MGGLNGKIQFRNSGDPLYVFQTQRDQSSTSGTESQRISGDSIQKLTLVTASQIESG